MPKNRQVLLAARPSGFPAESDFRLVDGDIPSPSDGEVLVRTLYLSLDPYMRGRMNDAKSYAPPVALNSVMIGGVVGEVVESHAEGFSAGDIVEGRIGWQEYGLAAPNDLRLVDPSLGPLTTALGPLGMTGLTAHVGLLQVGRPEPGQTVLVSSAAGAVGSVVGQIAKIKGCRVVGIAGGAEKCRTVTDEFGFDAAVDYKADGDLTAAIAAACPDGVDVFFDNTGGAIADAALSCLARGARVAICGTISQTSLTEPELGPRVQGKLMTAWASMQAFNVFQFNDLHPDALRELATWVRDGKIRYREHIVDGLENAPAALIALLQGKNTGKMIVKVAEGETA